VDHGELLTGFMTKVIVNLQGNRDTGLFGMTALHKPGSSPLTADSAG